VPHLVILVRHSPVNLRFRGADDGDLRTKRPPLGCRIVAYVRAARTGSGATAVQIVHSSRRGSRDIERIGSAHDEPELAALSAAARQRLAAAQPRTRPWLGGGGRGGWRAAGDHFGVDGAPAGGAGRWPVPTIGSGLMRPAAELHTNLAQVGSRR
jgi:hypothetical protein